MVVLAIGQPLPLRGHIIIVVIKQVVGIKHTDLSKRDLIVEYK